MAISDAKKELLNQIFLLYWKWDTKPDWDNIQENSPEDLLLEVYEGLKQGALSKYPWRCLKKYSTQQGEENPDAIDKKFKYESTLPEDFLFSTGYWIDSKRLTGMQNGVQIVGKKAKSNTKTFLMEYISKNVDESEMDPWLIDYIALYVAMEASDIGGCSAETKNFLIQKEAIEFVKFCNKDYEMDHKEEVSSSIHQFEYENWS